MKRFTIFRAVALLQCNSDANKNGCWMIEPGPCNPKLLVWACCCAGPQAEQPLQGAALCRIAALSLVQGQHKNIATKERHDNFQG